jgi:hypothetical protein
MQGLCGQKRKKKLRKEKERKRNLCDTYAYDPFQTNMLEVEGQSTKSICHHEKEESRRKGW